jgi:hypothetical protein
LRNPVWPFRPLRSDNAPRAVRHILAVNPLHLPLRYLDGAFRSLTVGGLGSVGEKAANALSDFVLVDMFANYCTGREDLFGGVAEWRILGVFSPYCVVVV